MKKLPNRDFHLFRRRNTTQTTRTRKSITTTPITRALFLCLFLWGGTKGIFYLSSAFLVRQLHIKYGLFMGLYFAFITIGSFVSGNLHKRYSARIFKITLPVSLFLIVISGGLVLLVFHALLPANRLYLFSSLFGFSEGVIYSSLPPLIWAIKRLKPSKWYGFSWGLQQLSLFTGSILTGFILDMSHGFQKLYFLFILLTLSALVLSLASLRKFTVQPLVSQKHIKQQPVYPQTKHNQNRTAASLTQHDYDNVNDQYHKNGTPYFSALHKNHLTENNPIPEPVKQIFVLYLWGVGLLIPIIFYSFGGALIKPFINLFMKDVYGWSFKQIGFLMASINVFNSLFTLFIAQKTHNVNITAFVLRLSGVLLLLLGIAFSSSAVLTALFLVLFISSMKASFGIYQGLVARVVHPRIKEWTSSVVTNIWAPASVLSLLLSDYIKPHGYQTMFLIASLSMIIGLFIHLGITLKIRKRQTRQ